MGLDVKQMGFHQTWIKIVLSHIDYIYILSNQKERKRLEPNLVNKFWFINQNPLGKNQFKTCHLPT